MTLREAVVGLMVLAAVGVARPACAQGEAGASPVNEGRHRLFAELGGYRLAKEDDLGFGLGAGYGFRPLRGLELSASLRYLWRPDREREYLVSLSPRTVERSVDEGHHFWVLGVAARGYLSFGEDARFELGLSGRLGLVSLPWHDAPFCCQQVAVAPDLRVKVARNTAIAFAPELTLATTGNDPAQSQDHVDAYFGYASVWLSVVQTL